jgi:hypothetical protein
VHPTSGVVTYTHDGVSTGVDSFTYTVEDTVGATSNLGTVVLNILEAPSVSITDPSEGGVALGPDVTVSYDLAGDNSLFDHLHWRLDGGNVVMQFAPFGTWDLIALASGPHSVEVVLADGQHSEIGLPGASDTLNFSVNYAPTANDDDVNVTQASALPISVLSNDSDDVAFDPTTVAATQGVKGSVSVHPTSGVVTYTHDGVSTGVDSFTYTVDDTQGATSNAGTVTVTILNAAPSITAITPDLVIDEGASFAYSATASDPGPADPLTFEWELSGDGLYDEFSETPGTGTQSSGGSVSLEAEGVYAMGVRVSDGFGGETTAGFSVTVQNGDPVLEYLTGAQQVGPGQAFNFLALASDPGPQDVLTFQWDLDDDGQFDDLIETPAGNDYSSGTSSFATPGLYTVSVRVIDGEGGETTGSFEVNVGPAAEVPALSSPARLLLTLLMLAVALAGGRRSLSARRY